MNFQELLGRAQAGEEWAEEKIMELYHSLLMKEAMVNGVFDEDLYQELCITLLKCIRIFEP